MDLDKLSQQQDENGSNILRYIGNYKKTPKERRSLEHTQASLEQLNNLWLEFNRVDSLIRAKFGNETSHPYFVKDYHRAVGEKCTEARELMEANLQAFKFASGTPQPIPSTATTTSTTSSGPSAASTATTTSTTSSGPSAANTLTVQSTTQIQLTKLQKLIDVVLDSLEKGLKAEWSPRAHAIYCKSILQHWEMAQDIHRSLMTANTGNYDLSWFLQKEQEVNEQLIMLQDMAEEAIQLGASSHNTTNLKLPKIVIPVFDGNNRKWKQFQDMFETMIHKQATISAIEKFYYLKSNLSGEASRLISHLLVTEENYHTAWNTLVNRFDNSRVLVASCLADLLSTQSLTSENQIGLKRFHDHTKECLLAVKNLGVPTEGWDPIILQILLPKLDAETRRLYELSLKRPRELQSLKEFYEFLELRFQSLEAAGSKIQPGNTVRNKYSNNKQSVLLAKENTGRPCPKCRGTHKLYKCEAFGRLPAYERLNFVTRSKLCINCLNADHTTSSCPSKNCTKCPESFCA